MAGFAANGAVSVNGERLTVGVMAEPQDRAAIAGYLDAQPLLPRVCLRLVGNGERWDPGPAVDVWIVRSSIVAAGTAVRYRHGAPPYPTATRGVVAIIDGLTATDVPWLLLSDNLHGIIPTQVPLEEVGAAVETVARGGRWISQAVFDRPGDSAGGATRLLASVHLTPGERQVVRLVVQGLSNRDIADRMHIEETTVRTHIRASLRKTGCANRHQLTALFYQSWLGGSGSGRRYGLGAALGISVQP
ncbi:response regulator transcription factor [Phytohabitans sp. ZYX-F-186]|uniref:Response regulator transcription factor n=1 Tax=Phytohabitans maris TaxID=3071409 RepID=A0ABU0ZK64_9ACTN|nr:response regulator transcription factor [Phytohabitans sp. ZYX-F-186]MDQ7907429.1 response regulator transcription factor [Phytohabitans sp. ZYX-F-186]